ncbi:MAG: HAD family hydrolase, partial [Bacilli bacterium]|nr:HAD family hydrolase [Bacilli bacterium]
ENGKDNSNYQDVLDCFRNHYKDHYLDNTVPYAGMKGLLIMLKHHYSLAVVSNKIDFITKKLINHFFPNLFDYIQGDIKELKKKPHPDMVNHVMKELHRRRKSVCYIGDTNVDYETAMNARIDVLLVTYGYRTKEEMKEYNINAPTVDSIDGISHYFIQK